MSFYLYHHKSTEKLATESKTNDHFPCHMSNMDCSQVAGVNIWLLVPLVSNQVCSFPPALKSTCSHGTLFGPYIDFLKVIKWQFDTQFKKKISYWKFYKSVVVVPMVQYFFLSYHSKWKNKITHDLYSKGCSFIALVLKSAST